MGNDLPTINSMSGELVPSRWEIAERALVAANAELLVALATGTAPSLTGVLTVVADGIRERHRSRGRQFVGRVVEQTGPDQFKYAIEHDPERETLFLNALQTAMTTDLDNKRVYLARVVANAFIGDDQLDHSVFVAEALRDLSGAHIRALTKLRAADDANQADPGMNDEIFQAALGEQISPVLAALVRCGVVKQGSQEVSPGLHSIPKSEYYSITGVNDFGREILKELEAVDTN